MRRWDGTTRTGGQVGVRVPTSRGVNVTLSLSQMLLPLWALACQAFWAVPLGPAWGALAMLVGGNGQSCTALEGGRNGWG